MAALHVRAAKESRGEETGDEAEVHQISGWRPAQKKTAAKKAPANGQSRVLGTAAAMAEDGETQGGSVRQRLGPSS